MIEKRTKFVLQFTHFFPTHPIHIASNTNIHNFPILLKSSLGEINTRKEKILSCPLHWHILHATKRCYTAIAPISCGSLRSRKYIASQTVCL